MNLLDCKELKNIKRGFFLLLCSVLTMVACSDDNEHKIEGKWQLRQYEYADGTVQKEDSVFYNFQKGVFSAIKLRSDGQYMSFFGNYSLSDDKISIILHPQNEYELNEIPVCLGWKSLERIFIFDNLTKERLVLRDEKSDEVLMFRKY